MYAPTTHLCLIASLCLVLSIHLVSGNENDWNIYYDLEDIPVPRLPGLRENTLRYGWLPCDCQDYTCGCCMHMNINFANFSRSGCMNFTYLPDDFAVQMNLLMNDESIYTRNVSAKNPPPACMEVPITYLPSMQFCVKLFDIYTPGRNLHMCVDFETRIERAPVLVLQFDCFVMGNEGFSHQKPTSSTPTVGGAGSKIPAEIPPAKNMTQAGAPPTKNRIQFVTPATTSAQQTNVLPAKSTQVPGGLGGSAEASSSMESAESFEETQFHQSSTSNRTPDQSTFSPLDILTFTSDIIGSERETNATESLNT